jgi:hypothetical protein
MDSSSSEQRTPRRHGDNSLPAIHQPSSQLTDPLPSSELEDPYAEAEHGEGSVEVIDDIVNETRDLWATLRNRNRRQYNIAAFLKSWCRDRDNKTALLADALTDKDVREALEQRGVTITLASDNTIFDTRQLRREMRILSQNPGFGEFKPYDNIKETDNKISEVSNTQWLESTLRDAWPTMKRDAPRLVAFLSQMLVNWSSGARAISRSVGSLIPMSRAGSMRLASGAIFLHSCRRTWTILSWSIGVSLTQSNAVMHATTLSARSQLSLFTNARL